MDDDLKDVLVSAQQAGQPAQPSSGESGKGAMDPDKLAALIDQRLENFSRQQQSRLDKFEARVNKKVQAVQAAGVEITPDVINAIRRSEQDEEPSAVVPSEPKPAQAKTLEPAPTDWRLEIRDELYEEFGMRLEKDDPELDSIDASKRNKLATTLRQALEAKQARIAQAKTLAAQGRLPVVPAGGSPGNLEQEYRDKLSKIRRGDVLSITRLQGEYRTKGLKI